MFGIGQMNCLKWLFRLFGKRDFVCSPTSKIHGCASIVNIAKDKTKIKIGAFSHIKGELLTFAHGGKILIGDYCYVGENAKIWSALNISIGNRVLIAHSVNIFDNLTHPINPARRHEHFRQIITRGHPAQIDLEERTVFIDDDAWVGAMSIILPGITVGKGSIIGAGSVVTKDVPPYTIVAGNPARIVRTLEPDER